MIQDQNCEVLKGFIARCRFFVGARTHATIAAYSSCVPTLVSGYSVKARGIAKDLFGSEDHYVVSVQDLNRTDILTDAFCWVMEREEMIREHLKSVIPEVKKRAQDAAIYLNKMIQ